MRGGFGLVPGIDRQWSGNLQYYGADWVIGSFADFAVERYIDGFLLAIWHSLTSTHRYYKHAVCGMEEPAHTEFLLFDIGRALHGHSMPFRYIEANQAHFCGPFYTAFDQHPEFRSDRLG